MEFQRKYTKKAVIVFGFLLLTIFSFAQTADLKWETDFPTAEKMSQQTGKPILILFSGSDWCKPCIKLKHYILETPVFEEYSQRFILYNADFPYKTKQQDALVKQNEQLAEQYNPEGKFPKVVYLSADHKVLGSTGFIDCSPNEYIKKIEEIIN